MYTLFGATIHRKILSTAAMVVLMLFSGVQLAYAGTSGGGGLGGTSQVIQDYINVAGQNNYNNLISQGVTDATLEAVLNVSGASQFGSLTNFAVASGDFNDLVSLVTGSPAAAVGGLVSGGGALNVATVLDQFGGSQLSSLVNSTNSIGNLSSLLTTSGGGLLDDIVTATGGAGNLSSLLNTSNGGTLGNLVKNLGLTDYISLLNQVGLSNVATILQQATGGDISGLLSSVGFTGFLDAISSLGLPDFSTLLGSVGWSGFNTLLQDVGLSGLSSLLGTITSGDLGSFVSSIGSLDFGTILSNIGLTDFTSLFKDIGLSDALGFFGGSASIADATNLFSVVGGTSLASTIRDLGGSVVSSGLDALGVSGAASAISSGSLSNLLGGGGNATCSGSNLLSSSIQGLLGQTGQNLLGSFSAAGISVPVTDATQISLQQTMVQLLQSQLQTQEQIRILTDVICAKITEIHNKEFVQDRQLHNAWREVIGYFAAITRQWAWTALNANPIFLTNPTIYYQLVDDEVYISFLREVADSNIGQSTKREIIGSLLVERFESLFPYNFAGGQLLAPDGVATLLSEDYFGAGGEVTYNKLIFNPDQNITGLTNIARSELERRRQKMRDFEEQKLNWGEGFFSYEICDQDVYVNGRNKNTGAPEIIREDRRNCRIVTPGSLIQDQISFLFSSAIRQMELADEIGEWVSASSIAVMNDILNSNGFNTDNTRTIAAAPLQAVDPATGRSLIIPGTPPPSGRPGDPHPFPAEFDVFIDTRPGVGGGLTPFSERLYNAIPNLNLIIQ